MGTLGWKSNRKGKSYVEVYGKKKADQWRQNISISHKSQVPWNKGLTKETDLRVARISEKGSAKRLNSLRKVAKTEAYRRHCRVAALKRIQKLGGPRFGRNETFWLDTVEQSYHCKILRQYSIKNLSYFVDGYCPETNTVYEVYEPFHDKQIEKDLQRQKEIQEHLQCKFITIHERELIWELQHSQMFFT